MSQQSPSDGEKNTLPPEYQPYDKEKQDVHSDTAVLHPVTPPKELLPNDYLALSLVVSIVCGIINITSLLFSIPAVVCSAVARIKRDGGLYATSKKYALSALILNCVCVAWTMAQCLIAVGIIFGCLSEAGSWCRFTGNPFEYED